MFKKIVQLFKLLNSNSKASQIANSFCIGFLLGILPKDNLLWYLLFVFFLFVRIHKGCYGIMILLGSLIAPVLDPLFEKIGYAVLTFTPMENIFSKLLDIPFVGFTKFNNTVVMGSLVSGLLVYVPLFVLVLLFVGLWRKTLAPRISNSKFMAWFYKLPLVVKFIEAK
ncbi:MAG: TIGR03546 family protein [Treponema sp.]|nr:TIGR03546 family protein [Treponema sp.]